MANPYGRGRVVQTHSAFYNEDVTVLEYVPYRDGTRSVWVRFSDGVEASFRDYEIELTEVYR